MGLIFAVIICAFQGGTMYDCHTAEVFEDEQQCEEVARDYDEAKGLTAYCTIVAIE